MSLALLSGVNPRVCKNGPKVRLHEGDWRIRHVGVVDSILSLPDGIILEGDCVLQVAIITPGTEQHFSVFAEPVKWG